jgi:hypothetical protein
MSIEKSNDLIGNRIHDFSACSIVPQPTTLLNARLLCPVLCFAVRVVKKTGNKVLHESEDTSIVMKENGMQI